VYREEHGPDRFLIGTGNDDAGGDERVGRGPVSR